jgi:phage terminase Nu1 subunit (DNA packaging protein)
MSLRAENLAAVAALFNLSEPEVQALQVEKVIPPPLDGKFDIFKCTQAYILHLRENRFHGSADDLGAVMGIGRTGVQRLVREENMPRESRGVFDFRQSVPWYMEKWKRKAEGHDDAGRMADEKLMLIREQRIRAQLERQAVERNLVPREDCEAGWVTLAGLVVAAFGSMVARLAPTMCNLETPAEARAILKREEFNVREQLAAEITQLAEELRGPSGEDHRPAAQQDA